jgi:hypothetical protein
MTVSLGIALTMMVGGIKFYRGASRFQLQIIQGADPQDICWPEAFLVSIAGVTRIASIGLVVGGGALLLC